MNKAITAIAILAAVKSALAQSPVWGQCGGIGWTGSTTCTSGNSCITLNPYYSQCQPGGAQGTTTTTRPPTTTSTSTTTTRSTTTTFRTSSSTTTTTTTTVGGGSCPALSTSVQLVANTALPDPFTFASGTKVTSKAQFKCRQQELSNLMQTYELGVKPGKPQSLSASFSGSTLTINVSDNGKSISFSVTITKPSGSGPFPAIIGYDGGSIPVPNNVAKISFGISDIAAQANTGSRGQGKFYTLYGSGHSAGALMAWAWGVSRIIDALEITPSAGINPARIGVTGCSRNGKGAFVAGAFDDRIALTLPQESGSGGSACWRLSDYQKSQGQNVQTASQIITENVWLSTSFNSYVNSVRNLPFDHHSLAAITAPRGLFVIENTDMEWLGALSTYGCMKVGQLAYQALGATSNMGYSQIGGHSHCAFPSGQQSELSAFINRFLLDQSVTTNVFRTTGNFNFNQAQWQPWSVPSLS